MDAHAIDAALAALEDTVGDPQFVGELLGDFLGGLPAQMATLHTAAQTGDLELVHRVAHTLRSNASTFGATALADACRALEQAARDGGTGSMRELLADVDAEVDVARPALAAARDERAS